MLLFTSKSKIGYASSNSKTLKLNIPHHVSEAVGFNPSEYINWEVHFENDELFVILKKNEKK